jgi:uncharacterized protein with HEPN domain
MPSKSEIEALEDIRANIKLAKSFVDNMTLDRFATDQKTNYAVVRCLEIISETSRRLAGDMNLRHPQIPWRAVAGAGNVYRHNYQSVTDDMIWQTVNVSLDAQLSVVEEELARASGSGPSS